MFNIRFYKSEDARSIQEILDDQLGKDYVTLSELESKRVLVAKDCNEENCLGVCIFYVDSNNCGVVKTIATAVKNQGKGIARLLIAKAVEILKDEGVERIISPLWKHGSIINSDYVFRINGFVPIQEIPNFWFEDSKIRGYSCPVCGFPCKCSCVIYEKML